MTTDLLEREVDLAFLQEIWEQYENKSLKMQLKKMLEYHGLSYMSKPRPKSSNGTSYGGVAIIINTCKFYFEKLDVPTSESIEAIWCMLKPKDQSVKCRNIIACSFYSPPDKGKN